MARDFWGRVQKGAPDECWPWLGRVNKSGYGIWYSSAERRWRYAHRVAYELANGCLLDYDRVIMHTCDNPVCCNPSHLVPGTHIDNRADCVAKCRHAFGERHGRHKLTAQAVNNIRYWWTRGLATKTELARLYGVSQWAITLVIRRVTWRTV